MWAKPTLLYASVVRASRIRPHRALMTSSSKSRWSGEAKRSINEPYRVCLSAHSSRSTARHKGLTPDARTYRFACGVNTA